MQHITSTAEFREYVTKELDFRFDCGFLKPAHLLDLSDRDKLIRAIWLHYVFFLPHAELEQLKNGLQETLHLGTFICDYPKEMQCFLVTSTHFDVSSDYLLDSMIIRYSDHGSNKRTAEEAIILNWTEYVTECSGMYVILCKCLFDY